MKTFKYIAVLGTLSLPLVSCSDFLDEDNKSTGNENGNAYIQNEPSVLRATAYNSLKSFVTDIDMQDLSTDLFANWRSTNDGTFAQFAFATNDGTIENYYKNLYTTINYANAMIEFGGAETELGAQGRFLRGLCYYYLTQQFGSVPYVSNYISSSERSYPRTDLAEVYTSVINDLTEVYKGNVLPATDHTGNISKQAVAALIAKVELAAGWDLDTKLNNAEQGTYTVENTSHFTEAAKWAELAINNTALTMSFEQKWAPANEDNDEVIFAVNWLREGFPGDEATGGHSLQNMYCPHVGASTSVGQKGNGSGGQNQISSKALYLWGPGDSRFDGTFMTTCYNAEVVDKVAIWGTQGYYAYYNATPEELSNMTIAMRYFPYYTTEADFNAYCSSMADRFKAGTSYGIPKPYVALLDGDNTIVNTNSGSGFAKTTTTYVDFVSNTIPNLPAVKKFDDPASSPAVKNNDYRNVVLLHVSQMYLTAAEAYLMAGNEAKAIAKINDVRKRAGAPETSFSAYPSTVEYVANTPNFTINNIDLILDELARETYAERTRFADLRRTKQLVRYNLAFSRSIHSVTEMSNSKGEIKWYRPIPQAEIDANTGMTLEDQNPGY